MKKYIKIIIMFLVLVLYSGLGYTVPSDIDCIGNDGKWYILSNDPHNGTNIVVNSEVYRFMAESIIGNKKVATYVNDAGIVANVILIVQPGTSDGDIYIVIYLGSESIRGGGIDKLNLHCKF